MEIKFHKFDLNLNIAVVQLIQELIWHISYYYYYYVIDFGTYPLWKTSGWTWPVSTDNWRRTGSGTPARGPGRTRPGRPARRISACRATGSWQTHTHPPRTKPSCRRISGVDVPAAWCVGIVDRGGSTATVLRHHEKHDIKKNYQTSDTTSARGNCTGAMAKWTFWIFKHFPHRLYNAKNVCTIIWLGFL